MSNNLLAVWHSECDTGFTTTVFPDGCRDLIMKVVGNDRPQWFVSSLFDTSESVPVESHSSLTGFRLKPGVEIKEEALLQYIKSRSLNPDEVPDILDEFVHHNSSIDEALSCLASDVSSIKQASVRLGVSSRTLQRFILHKTGRTPGYWFQLARVRKAAKSLSGLSSLVETAEIFGFSDQPHMNREFQRWLKATPLQILKTPEFIKQLNDKGYG